MVQNAFNGLDASPAIKCKLAFHSILNHELFHFATDYAVSQLEMIWSDALWVPAREEIRGNEPHYLEIEEKLANAYMLGHLRSAPKAKGKTEALRQFVSKQPPGYRDGINVRSSQWDYELGLLVNAYFPIPDFAIDWSVLYPLSPRVDWRYCPIHVIHDERRLNISDIHVNLFAKIENIEESGSFQRQLNRLPVQIQKKWGKFKDKSSVLLTPGMRFQQWPQAGDDIYSARVDDNYRAHLKCNSKGQSWTALAIGNHTEMGHG